ncbi:MAG: phosphoenolpyruvate synthase, partial [Candidatus Paceibacterota bacterium]
MEENKKLIVLMDSVGIEDVGLVGGKNASLGEMIKNLARRGVPVPSGFIVTAEAYQYFLKKTGLAGKIRVILAGLDTRNLRDLAKRGKEVRETIKKTKFPDDLREMIVSAYADMEKKYGRNVDVAVRSSATAEDLPGASFAGEHDTYLGIRGADAVAVATLNCMASLFTDRAISYRVDKGFDHFKVSLSVGVQKMVRSDMGASGVMFTVDTETGFRDVILINASWGLGEMVVQGEVTPDEYLVFKKGLGEIAASNPIIGKTLGVKDKKMTYASGTGAKRTKVVSTTDRERKIFVLSDEEIKKLANWGFEIEKHYSSKHGGAWMPMDIEWAKDGKTGELFIVQARPETVQAGKDFSKIKEYERKGGGEPIAKGASVGSKIAVGKAHVILDVKQINSFKAGEILVTDMTDPDWEPIMKIAAAIVTNKGGRTSHAAIVSRELGIPAVVGTENASRKIKTG